MPRKERTEDSEKWEAAWKVPKGAADPENLISHFRNLILISKVMRRLLTDFKESFQFKSSVRFAIKFPLSNTKKEPEYADGDNVALPFLTKFSSHGFLEFGP